MKILIGIFCLMLTQFTLANSNFKCEPEITKIKEKLSIKSNCDLLDKSIKGFKNPVKTYQCESESQNFYYYPNGLSEAKVEKKKRAFFEYKNISTSTENEFSDVYLDKTCNVTSIEYHGPHGIENPGTKYELTPKSCADNKYSENVKGKSKLKSEEEDEEENKDLKKVLKSLCKKFFSNTSKSSSGNNTHHK